MENQTELKWYQKPTGIIILLIVFFPVGLFLMWKNEIWTKKTRWIVTGAIALLFIASAGGDSGLNGKKFMHMNNAADLGAVIEFESNEKCSFFLTTGTFKNSTLGSYILEKDQITFSWDKGIGPKSGKLIKDDSNKSEWKIAIGTTVYTEYKD